ncbi:alpha-1,4-glucan--maltose-1-phosphate maltosyltransferase [Stakelama pacifica]|uniref:Alpha-1,4-glucan:maltose-1-phosphate maltosyltransferase n=1 Tax=Stakelama pacifica TaxID=517720 RepID=A0A4V3BUH2_9SPHN|nr:alpha-1,4-glucan--maltose-1-phosphate maltosyltransferase [Stakelama pacifica]TDN86568.1 alpha-1,4-glucan:maltose-1-phosphate maltosyltransferase [Stakelama pacifica]GGO90028.1 hypothetical protein GCM10011329_01380 [Stakelama pacifica]
MVFPARRTLSAPLYQVDPDRIGTTLSETGAGMLLLTGVIPLLGEESDSALQHIPDIAAQVPALAIEIDLARFPIDHPLVDAHPDLFTLRRSGGARAVVDPRRPMAATGQAMARLRASETADRLGDAMIDRLGEFVAAGVRCFRLIGAERIADPLLQCLRAALDSDVALIAGAVGDRARAAALGAAGLDALIASYGWWDMDSRWMVEEVEALRGHVPLIAEFAPERGLSTAALALAPLATDGFIVPAGWARQEGGVDAIRSAFGTLDTIGTISGELRQASAPGGPLLVLVRSETSDARQAASVLVGIANHTDSDMVLPSAAALLQASGAPSGHFQTLDGGVVPDVLGAGETLLLRVAAAGPVTGVRSGGDARRAREWPRLVVDELSPSVTGGDFAVKRVVGDTVQVEADVYADGHEQLAAELHWRAADEAEWRKRRMTALDNDRWRASFVPERLGAHEFRVAGWLDRFHGFTRDFRKKLNADVAQPVDYREGVELVREAQARAEGELARSLSALLAKLDGAEQQAQAALLLDPETAALMDRADDRPHLHSSPIQRLDAERLAARFSSWYELFPRSITDDKARHGTFADVIERLPAIRDMGFDTLYFPPIHPIGKTNRKGPNNTLTPGPNDPGSPYAIGSEAGGHDAIHPELGSFDDFDRLVAAAHDHGLEIALDFAIQCAPDHPWLKEHPGWFAWRPDGSMKYAENPPKKYQDIVNVDFYGPDAVPDLWIALRDVVLLWVDHGVKTFRVDNPHTKPLPFWEWMIAEVRAAHPDVIFLAEAFTRPTMMYRLAKVGFSQSYTYFTWRDTKHDLTEYITELTTTAPREFYRPHFFVNTPDINPTFLQHSGRAGFRIRAVLAATLSGLFGVYSGFELCESAPLAPGKEEYLDSEKYEILPRDYQAPGNIIADITLLNRLRRAYPALQTHLNTRFYAAYNDNILWYAKPAEGGASMIMVMVNLDPHHAQECDFEIPLWEFGLADHDAVAVEDLAAGHRFNWHGKTQHITIAPDEPYRIWRIAPEERA